MLRERLIFGPIFIAALIAVVWADEAIESRLGVQVVLIFPMVLLIAMLVAHEFTAMVRGRGHVALSRVPTMAAVAAGVTISSFTPVDLGAVSGVALACSTTGAVLFLSMVFYARNRSARGVVASAAATVMAFVYIGLMSGFIVVLAQAFSGWVVLGVLLTTKSCDIGAYFTGKSIGRHKLIEWLSPKKTWEGLVGGVLTSTLLGAGLVVLAPDRLVVLELWQGALLGFVFGLVGQAGDLIASLVKRDMGAKDSSATLPGFGGLLDVADSPLLVAPVAYWLLTALSTT